MTNKGIENQLEIWAHGSPREQADALRKLLSARKHNDAAKGQRFSLGMERLYNFAGSSETLDEDRLLAVSTLGRIASSIRALRESIIERLKNVLIDPLPAPHLLNDVDERAYVGKVCAATLPNWVTTYSAEAIVTEETGEQVRQAFLEALVKASPDLETAIQKLSEELTDFIPETEEPANSMAVKLRRILAAMREVMADVRPETGEAPGPAVARLIKVCFSKVGPPGKKNALLATAEELAGVIHELVRLRFSIATDAATYQAILQLRDLIPTDAWEQFANKSANVTRVAEDITEALLILARQGVADTNLARQLTYAVGKKSADGRRRDLGARTGIPPEVKTWLIEGRLGEPAKKQPTRGESQQLSEDVQIADLLVNVQRFKSTESVVRGQVFPELEMLTPQTVPELEKLLNFGLGLGDGIAALATNRGLRVRGNPGDEEEYSPLEHELVDGSAGGAKFVRVLRPAVEQVKSNGVAIVLRKGLVEKVN